MADIALLGIKVDPSAGILGLRKFERQATATEKHVINATKKIGKAFAVMLPIIGAAAVKMSSDFQKGMREISTLMDDINDRQLKRMGQQVQDLRIKYGQLSKEATKALFDISSAGFQGEEGMKVLEASAKLAVAGVSDVSATADLLTSALNAYGLEAKEAGRLSDVFFSTQKAGKTTISELAEVMGQILPTAKLAGISIEELGGSFAALTIGGIKSSEAVTALNQLILSLVAPTEDAAEAMAELLIQVRNQRGELLPLFDILKQMEGLDAETLSRLFPSVRAFKAAGALINNLEAVKQSVESVKDGAGNTEKAFEKMADTASSRFAEVSQAMKVLLETLGDTIIESDTTKEALTGLRDIIKDMVVWVRENENSIKEWGTVAKDSFLVLVDAIVRSIELWKAAFKTLAATILIVAGNLSLAVVTILNMTDAIGLTTDAAEEMMAAMLKWETVANQLFSEAKQHMEKFKGATQEASSAQETLAKATLDATSAVKKESDAVITLQKNLKDVKKQTEGFTNLEIFSEDVGLNLGNPQFQRFAIPFLTTLTEIEEKFKQMKEEQASTEFFKKVSEGAAIFERTRTPVEKYWRTLERLQELYDSGVLPGGQETLNRAIIDAGETFSKELKNEAGKTEEEVSAIVDSLEKLRSGFESNMTNTLQNLVKGTADFKDFFSDIIDDIVRELLRVAVVKPFIDSILSPSLSAIGGGISSFLGFAQGGEFRVGGIGGTDSQLVAFRASPDETVTIRRPGDQDRGRAGVVNNIGISVQVSERGVQTRTEGDFREFGAQLANAVKVTVLDMMRPGQPLEHVATGRR